MASWLVVAVTAAALTAPATAVGSPADEADDTQAPPPALGDAPDPFNGSFWELSLRGGPLLSSVDDASLGWTTDIGFRNSFPFYLADHRIAYGYSQFPVDDHTARLHSLHATFAIHPLYLTLLSEGLRSHFLSSLHLELGLGPRLGRLSPTGDDGASTDSFGVAASVGAGFDLPITDPNQGRAPWVNVVYRRTWSTVRFDDAPTSDRFHDHVIFLGLAWRNNGSIW